MTVLETSGAALSQLGRVGGLGKGERIYAVRFVGDKGYVVTFRQVDPLYTLDLSDKRAPKVLGELKILGYSAYLHPVSDDLLLGVGQDATEQGRRLGTQLSLFDVSDLRNPKRLAQSSLGANSSTTAEFDPHAFLFWKPASLAVIPLSVYARSRAASRSTARSASRSARRASREAGRVAHPAQARRELHAADRALARHRRQALHAVLRGPAGQPARHARAAGVRGRSRRRRSRRRAGARRPSRALSRR